MPAEPRRVWTGIVLPVDLHNALAEHVGPRGLTSAVASAMGQLVQRSKVPSRTRPPRDNGVVGMTLRLPVAVADAAERWRDDNGISRQAMVEYAALAALDEVRQ